MIGRIRRKIMSIPFWWARRFVRPRIARLLLARKNGDLEAIFVNIGQIRRWAGGMGPWWTAIMLSKIAICGGPTLGEDEVAGFQLQRVADDGTFEDVDVETAPAVIRAYGRFTTAVLNQDTGMTVVVWAELDRIDENILLCRLLDAAWDHIAEFHGGRMPNELG